ncbi:MAG: hypothetical protein ACI82S_002369 [Patiriisocius sp.]
MPQSTCSNCHAIITGPYCSQCGQSSESSIKYFWTVVLHILDDIFSFDSRASRTIWPLFTRPGFLTNEYFQGHRVQYVPPLRLYLFISIIFFITLKFFAASENNNLIRLNNDEKALTQVSSHIVELEQQHELLKNKENPEEKHLQAMQLAEQNIQKFKGYQNDLSVADNKLVKAIATELLILEFIKLETNQPLSENRQNRYTILTSQLNKTRKGEKINLLSIGNNSDGSISFAFLPPDKNQLLNEYASKLEEKASKALAEGAGQLLQQAISKLPQLMFLLLPLFAVLLKIMYLFSGRYYMEHLTVALHSHSFVFFNILVLEIVDMLQNTFFKTSPILDYIPTGLSIVLLIWVPIYLFIMQKRVYKQGYVMTLAKYLIVGIAYTALISITAIIAFVWGLAEL